MSLADTVLHHRKQFLKRYGHRLNDSHRHALSAICRCRTEYYGELHWRCPDCENTRRLYRSCGHRSCPRCQNHDNTQWLMRQQKKLLPVNYFMVTFTLPSQCREVAWQHQRVVYDLLFEAAVSTCLDFARRDIKLQGEIGQTAVLHTQTRRLDYHPHVHVIIPNGAIDAKRRCWREKRGRFLFAHKALAKVFRAKLLKSLKAASLLPTSRMPTEWVVDCRSVGSGLPALKYLSTYLYRGVIGEKQLLDDDGQNVTFSYREGGTGAPKTRTVEGATFVWLMIQHVLPRGYRRVRDYGFLHGNARRKLLLIQWCLRAFIPTAITGQSTRPSVTCTRCNTAMHYCGYRAPPRTGYG